MPAPLRALLAVLALVALAGCGSSLVPWTPVLTDAGGEADHTVSRNSVVVAVHEFGVLDGWGNPTGELRVFNGGSKPVTFDLATVRLDADGQLFPPALDASEPTAVTLLPGERFEQQLVFEVSLPIQPRFDNDSSDMQVITRELHLHLPSLVIDGAKIALPVFIYRNPDQMRT